MSSLRGREEIVIWVDLRCRMGSREGSSTSGMPSASSVGPAAEDLCCLLLNLAIGIVEAPRSRVCPYPFDVQLQAPLLRVCSGLIITESPALAQLHGLPFSIDTNLASTLISRFWRRLSDSLLGPF